MGFLSSRFVVWRIGLGFRWPGFVLVLVLTRRICGYTVRWPRFVLVFVLTRRVGGDVIRRSRLTIGEPGRVC
jgi:hypothetical protein